MKARAKEEAKQMQDNGKTDCLGVSTVAETVSYHRVCIISLHSSFYLRKKYEKKLDFKQFLLSRFMRILLSLLSSG